MKPNDLILERDDGPDGLWYVAKAMPRHHEGAALEVYLSVPVTHRRHWTADDAMIELEAIESGRALAANGE